MPATDQRPAFDATRFRHVIGHFMSGVTVISTRHEDRDHGMTASAVSSLSLDPPMLTACLHRQAPTQEAVVRSGAFAVNVLREGQDEIAARFARPCADKFAGVSVHYGMLGQPLLDGALATIECEVQETVVGGTHRVFLAAVRSAEVGSGAPLAYYRGRFGRLEIAADDDALRDVRRAVLRRAVAVDERLDPEALAQSLAAPVSSVEFALAQLLSERLVTRDADGYRQVALDARRSDDAFDAKLVIDLGAAQMAMTRAGDPELAQLEELAATTVPPIGAIGPELVERMVAANEEFHEAAIALAGNAALLDAYRQLRLTSVLSPVMWRAAGSARRLAEQHQLIASALRARDLARAQELITTHNRQARASHHQAIEVAGGRI